MSERLFIIAEIGTSHLGNRDKARNLIHAAAQSGADCAKFQVVIAKEIIHPLTGELDLPGGRVRLYDKFVEVEQQKEFYAYLKAETEACGMEFLASPFGLASARLLQSLGVTTFKVASPELNHLPLLEELRGYGKPLILSSGVSLLSDIEAAVNAVEGVPISLLHCITSYPAPPEEYNLRVLEPLKVLFGCPVGISDHSLDPELVPLTGLIAGASLLEKHFCLSHDDPGLDDKIALDPTQFATMTQAVRELEVVPLAHRRAHLDARFGSARIEAVLGNGRKLLAASERANYERTNRSLHVWKTLPAGHRLQDSDLAELRTEKVLRPGLSPAWRSTVVGKLLTREVEEGQGLVWEDLLS